MPIAPPVGAAMVSGGAALMNTLIGSSSSQNLNEANRYFQRQMAKDAYMRQRELTRDSPSLTKQGLLNAGMSPAALDGYTGSAAQVSTPSGPSGQFSPYVPLDAGQVVDAYLAAKQGQVADSQVNKNNAEANKANEEAGVVKPLADAQIKKLETSTRLDSAEIDKIAATLPVLNNQSDYWREMARVEKNAADIQDATKQEQIDSLKATYKLSEHEASVAYDYVQKMAAASYELITSEVYNNRAQASAAISNATTNRLEYELDTIRVKLAKMGVDADVALKGAQAAYQEALKGAVPSQIAANKAAAEQSKGAAKNQRAQAKHHDAMRRNIPFDNMIKGANTFISGVNAAGGVVGRAIPFLLGGL